MPGSVLSLAQLADGSLWVGTEFGIVRFDGVTFLPLKLSPGQRLPNSYVSALAPALGGGLWIGTRAGLFHWQSDSLETYSASQEPEGLGISAILVDRSGSVWVGKAGFQSGGLCRVQAKVLHCYGPADGFPSGAVFSLFEDRSGSIWVGAIDGLYQWESGVIRHWGSSEVPGQVGLIAEGGAGELILSTSEAPGLKRFMDGKLAGDPFRGASEILHLRTLLTDRNGALWIGTNGQGLIHVYQGHIDRFSHADGLSGDIVFHLFEDREGNIWAATDRGLDRFRDLPVITISKREGLSEDTAGAVAASRDGGVWIGTASGLNYIKDGKITVYGIRDGLPSDSIISLFEDRERILWVDTTQGLTYFHGGRFRALNLPNGQKINYVAAAAEDRDRTLWFSDLERGLIKMTTSDVGTGGVAELIPWARFNDKQSWALEADLRGGGLWLGFRQGGIAYYARGQPIRWYTKSEGLPEGAVSDLYFDRQGILWIATTAGLSRLRDGHIATLTTANGLPCDEFHAIVEDNDGAMWMNTSCGLVRIARSDLIAWVSDPSVKVPVKVYGTVDGMRVRSGLSGYFRGAEKSADGRLWFPVFDGVAVVDPKHLPENHLRPPVQIDRLTGDGEDYPVKSQLKLRPHIRDLQIDYTAFSFVAPEQMHFRYMLEGYDAGWKDAGSRRQTVYTNLPPRHYRFRVIASNNDGVWNETGASLDFEIRSAFYQTAWFFGVSVAAISLLLWTGYRLRVRQIAAQMNARFEERLAERARIARELHDTLLQNIAGLALQLGGLSKTVKEPASMKDRLHDLRQQAEEWLHDARESVWDLRAPLSEGQDFEVAVRKTVHPLAMGKAQLDVTVSGVRRSLPSKVQEHLLRISQEAVRNAIQHGGAKQIKMNIDYAKPEQIRVQIQDDGSGFDLRVALGKVGHWGLGTMRERAEKIGADMRISTAPGNGTIIDIIAPIRS